MGTQNTNRTNPPPADAKPMRRSRFAAIAHAAGAPGIGLVLSVLLIADAFAVGKACAWPSNNASLVGSLMSIPCGAGMSTPRRSNPLICTKGADGAWSVRIPPSESDIKAMEDLHTPGANHTGIALVTVQRRTRSGSGLWSPSIQCEAGRWLRVDSLDPTLTPQDESAAATAVFNAWPAMVAAGTVPLAETPLQPYESNAMSAGRRGTVYTPCWGWLVNDAAVFGAISLLFLGHPRRVQRRYEARALAERGPLTHCPACKYELTGLATDEHGDRRCPECGRTCGLYL